MPDAVLEAFRKVLSVAYFAASPYSCERGDPPAHLKNGGTLPPPDEVECAGFANVSGLRRSATGLGFTALLLGIT